MASGRSAQKQMAINIASSIAVFAMNMCISFFLSPFIISRLGTAAYGFIGLSNNFISYAGLLTIAVNSMSGRFISISVHKKDFDEANTYLSSLFFTNLILAIILLVAFTIFVIFMPKLINVPYVILSDVRTLFMLMGTYTCLGLILGVVGVSTFIKNRLDIGNIRSLIGTAINTMLLLLLFIFFPAHLWYYGLAGMVMFCYTISVNYHFFKKLTPELRISWIYFDYNAVRKLTAAGIWNVVSRLSGLLSKGFNLLLANLFINASAMGLLSIAQTIPSIILSFFGMLSGNFSPEFTRLYAIGDIESLKAELLKSIRISGFISAIPLCIFYAYGDIFYHLWLPTENANLLYTLSCVGSLGLIFALPQEPLWTIFTITNKVKRSSLNLLYNSLLTFAMVMLCVIFIKDEMIKLLCLAGISSCFGIFRVVTFLPLYGAKCLELKRYTFYPLIFKNLINVIVVTAISLSLKYTLLGNSWGALILGATITMLMCVAVSSFLVLKQTDREYIISLVKLKLNI